MYSARAAIRRSSVHAALEQDRLARAGALDEELEVLRIARADLEDVGRLRDVLHVVFAEHFGDDLEPGLLLCRGEHLQPFLAEPLEFVG
jgi:hypothetical protein